MKLHVILAQYDQQKYSDAEPKLLKLLSKLQNCEVNIVTVNNADEAQQTIEVSPNHWSIAGDNKVFEFSGWMRGIHFLREVDPAPDLYLIVTDAFMAYGDCYQDLLNTKILSFVSSQPQALTGLIDIPDPSFKSLELNKKSLLFWIRSSFFLITPLLLEKLQSFVHYTDTNDFCPPNYTPEVFLAHAPANSAYQNFILNWLQKDWHSAFKVNPSTWNRFTDKLRSILNEHSLTLRVKHFGGSFYDLRFLKQHITQYTAKGHFSELERWGNQVEKQLSQLQPSIWKRAFRKLLQWRENHE